MCPYYRFPNNSNGATVPFGDIMIKTTAKADISSVQSAGDLGEGFCGFALVFWLQQAFVDTGPLPRSTLQLQFHSQLPSLEVSRALSMNQRLAL